MKTETQINDEVRKGISDLLQQLETLPQSGEREHAKHYLTNAQMWLGRDIRRVDKAARVADPEEPARVDPAGEVVDPTPAEPEMRP